MIPIAHRLAVPAGHSSAGVEASSRANSGCDALVLLVSLAGAAWIRSGEGCMVRRAEKDAGLELSLKEVGA
jgi:hypothetical protein